MTTLSTSVIRPLILRLAGHPWFRGIATDTRPGRAVASRFVAGETVDQAMAVARELGPGKNVVTVLCDTGERYFSLEEFFAPEAPP